MMMSTAGKAISQGEAFSVPSSSFPKGDDPPPRSCCKTSFMSNSSEQNSTYFQSEDNESNNQPNAWFSTR